jgi:FG-GAP-like repeat/Beta-propeller repeat
MRPFPRIFHISITIVLATIRSLPKNGRATARAACLLACVVALLAASMSAPAHAGSTPQFITFAPPASKTFGIAPFQVVATSSSGLAVAMASLTISVCRTSGTNITIVAAGTCALRASQPGNTTYAAAAAIDRSFAISKATQTITFSLPVSTTFGVAPIAISATSSSGLAVTLTSTTSTICSIVGSALKIAGAGVCVVRATQEGSGNYNGATPVDRTLKIARAAQTITFGALSARSFGTKPFSVVASASSKLAIGFTSLTPSICSISSSTATLLAAGTCSLRASQPGDANYAAASMVTQSFTVAKAPQSIVFAAPVTHTIGDAPFALAASASSGIAVAFISTTPDVCKVASGTLTILAAGTCSITAAQAGNGNWLPAASVTRGFAVAKAAQSIAFPAIADHAYADPPFALVATSSSGLVVAFASMTSATCKVTGGTVTLIASGVCTVRTTQPGNGNYLPAPTFDRSFSISLASQAITFPSLPTKTFGDAPFTVTATATSGLAVAVASLTTDTCLIDGKTVRLSASGTCTLRATQPGDAHFAAAPAVDRSFTVSKAPQSIAFVAPLPHAVTDPPFAIAAIASSGLAVVFASATLPVCVVAAGTVTLRSTGLCVLNASQSGDGGYQAAAIVTRSFAVTAAAQAITFDTIADQSLASPSVSVRAASSSGLPVMLTSLSPTVCSPVLARVTLLATGTCALRATQAGNDIYPAASLVERSFAILGIPQTITFPPIADKHLADMITAVAATASSGLAVHFEASPPSICTNNGGFAITLLAPGLCSVHASQGGDSHYAAAIGVDRVFAIIGSPTRVHLDPIGPQTLAASPLAVRATSPTGSQIVYSAQPGAVCVASAASISLIGPGDCTVGAAESADGIRPSAEAAYVKFRVLLTPEFRQEDTFAVGPWPSTIVAGPFGNDRNISFVIPSQGRLTVLDGNGHGGFTAVDAGPGGPFPSAMFANAADFDGDGTLDFAFSAIFNDAIAIYIGGIGGNFELRSDLPSSPAPGGLVAVDFSGDGKIDLATVSIDSNGLTHDAIALFEGNGDGSFRAWKSLSTCGGPIDLAAGDFDNNGITDIAIACQREGSIQLLRATGNGNYQNLQPIPVDQPYRIATADLDGDGNLDLVVSSFFNEILVLRGRGDGSFLAPQIVANSPEPGDLAIADFNGDGTLDVATTASLGNAVYVLAGAGDGQFAPPVRFAAGTYPTGLVTADVDGDGRVDFAYVNMLDGTASVRRNAIATPAIAHVVAMPIPTRSTPHSQLTARVSDARDLPIAGILVHFDLPLASNATFADGRREADVTTDTNGFASTAPVIGAPPAGAYLATAQAAGIAVTFRLNETSGSTPPEFTTSTIPPGAPGVVYAFDLVARGEPAPVFSLESGALPAGLTLSASGRIGGTPLAPGEFSGSFRASNGNPPDALLSFSIRVGGSSQSISFNAIADQSIDARRVIPTAAASSGLSVTLASLTPQTCAMDGSAVSLLAAGRCTIRASQAGNAQYAAAPFVDRSFSVTQGAQAVMIGLPESARVGAGPTHVFVAATSGLPVVLTSVTPGTCMVTDGAYVNFLARGTCTLQASQGGDASHAAAQTTASTPVLGARQSIDFPPPRNGRIDELTFLLATASSGLPVTFESQTPDVCAIYFGNAAGVGDSKQPHDNWCTVMASQSGSDQYEPASTSRTFAFGFNPDPIHHPATATPHIVYAAYLGGLGRDQTFDVAVSADGGALVAGTVGTTNFPMLSSQAYSNGGIDGVFISKFKAQSAVIEYSAAVGYAKRGGGFGSDPQLAALHAMTVDDSGNAIVAAVSGGIDFPQRGGAYALDGPLALFRVDTGGRVHVVVSALDGAILNIRAIACDSTGAIYITGDAGPGLSTTAGAPVGSSSASSVPYLAKFTPTGSVVYATYLMTPGTRQGGEPMPDQETRNSITTSFALAVDPEGNAYVAGQATATDMPVTPGALDTGDHNNRDGFVVKINAAGTAIVFIARVGFGDGDRATGVAIAGDGSIVVAGKTASADDFAGSQAFQTRISFSQNGMQTFRPDREFGFLAKLDPTASKVVFQAAIGTFGGDLVQIATSPSPSPLRVAVDSAGYIYAAGTSFPDRTLPLIANIPGMPDHGVFLMKISPDGGQQYSTFLGAGVATGVATDSRGNAYVTGYSQGAMPTLNAEQAACGFGPPSNCTTPFVLKVNDAPLPVILATDQPTVDESTAISLHAHIADQRATGSLEFSDEGVIVGIVAPEGGAATLTISPSLGFHHYVATFHGSGYANGMASTPLTVTVRQRTTN